MMPRVFSALWLTRTLLIRRHAKRDGCPARCIVVEPLRDHVVDVGTPGTIIQPLPLWPIVYWGHARPNHPGRRASTVHAWREPMRAIASRIDTQRARPVARRWDCKAPICIKPPERARQERS